MNNRKQLIIKIPVKSLDVHEFTQRDSNDSHHFVKVSNQIFNFIEKTLQKDFKITNLYLDNYCFIELIKNSFDAYAESGLVVGEHLLLKVVVQQKNNKVLVKIKDNGTGFIGHARGERFDRSQISYQNKSSEAGYFGGKKLGLGMFEENLQVIAGKLELKNRRRTGASINIEFNAQQSRSFSA